MHNARDAGLVVSANSQVNKLTMHLLRETAAELRAAASGGVDATVRFRTATSS